MKFLSLLIIILGPLIILTGSCVVFADLTNLTDEQGNNSTPDNRSNLSDSNSTFEISLTGVTLSGVIPDDISGLGMKVPRSNLTFMSGTKSSDNFTGYDNVSNISLVKAEPNDKNLTNESQLMNNSLSQYDTLGEIIQAKDWKALGEYQCKIKNENSALFDDSGPDIGNQQGKWDGYFNQRDPVVISYPCCG